MPIFRVKSVKIYTDQKNLHEYICGVRDKYQVCLHHEIITIIPHLFKILPHFDRIRNFQVAEVTITKYKVTKLPVSAFIIAGVKDCLVIITWYTKVTRVKRGRDFNLIISKAFWSVVSMLKESFMFSSSVTLSGHRK